MAKKAASKKTTAKKAASGTKKAATKKTAAKKVTAAKAKAPEKSEEPAPPKKKAPAAKKKPAKLTAFQKSQQKKLLELRDHMVDAMAGVAQDNLRSRSEGSDASAFGMHQADAGSDAYDRDFALNLLSQEQDALYEIDEALKRLESGTYGICEMSGDTIPEARLEAVPFARLTVTCQEQWEKQNGGIGRGYGRGPTRSLFGLMEGGNEGVDSD
tara:strand:+ start:1459 stop:2097 length:639 start_codon:yes stop_codon:yes gene_type:complete